ncbi:MAG: bifunctional glutamate N-acetyltransferase/amino-acid acetyltransferase ArgJ [Candidatus Omnitrophota bacterium]
MKIFKNAILPNGFKISGIHCGIKRSKKKDLGLIYSFFPCVASGMFTSNKVQAASLKVCKAHLKNKQSRVILVNSGNANCFTGEKGVDHAIDIIKALAKKLGVTQRSILIASTGIIGKPLPIKIVKQAIPRLCQSLGKEKAKDFAQAILTTDTFKKCISLQITIKNKPVIITGFAKGAGMIYPKLKLNSNKHATMLAFILTDANISKSLLSSALVSAVDKSFNCISIDACMSTNDTVLAMANSAAKNLVISKNDSNFKLFKAALYYVCWWLSRMIVSDAEGATKLIDVSVEGAKSLKEAQLAASSVANSNLFKTAMFGGDPNWGRIVAAIGASGIALEQKRIQISFNNKKVFNNGRIHAIKPRDFLKKTKLICVDINLKRGKFRHSTLTSDLTPKYVKINAEYN